MWPPFQLKYIAPYFFSLAGSSFSKNNIIMQKPSVFQVASFVDVLLNEQQMKLYN